MSARERHLLEIQKTREELMTAKGLHRKDLARHLNQLIKDLKEYDMYHKRG